MTAATDAAVEAMAELVTQCRNVIEAHELRAEGYHGLTLRERQEIAVLHIRLEDPARTRGWKSL